ncbi:YeeE/YedE family protein [Paracoccaceae bacterium]|nr:YeeE/YedE family protein [Paracoccaceae bacterium]
MVLHSIPEALMGTLIGFAGGILLGLAALIGRFCTLGAIEDALYGQNNNRLRMWGTAIGMAVVLVHLALAQGLISTSNSYPLTVPFTPLLTVFGGLLFGLGMAFSGNCGFGALARLGGGDLRSFVIVLVIGVSAYVTLGGPLSPLRIWLVELLSVQPTTASFSALLSSSTGMPASYFGLLLGAGVFGFSVWNRAFWEEKGNVIWGALVGLSVASGWIGTHLIAQVGFSGLRPISHGFTAPVGSTILYFMTSSGQTLNFGIGSVCGVWAGALTGSLMKGHFRLEACEDPRELQRQITGAVMMGIGGVLAIGCSVGQGISAMALLSINAPLALSSIFIGAYFGLNHLISGRLI